MTLREIYEFAIRKGFEVDPRGRDALEQKLKALKADYEKMPDREKEVFDEDRLTNPFGDTRIVCGDPNREVKRVMVGIDIHGQEILAPGLRMKCNRHIFAYTRRATRTPLKSG